MFLENISDLPIELMGEWIDKAKKKKKPTQKVRNQNDKKNFKSMDKKEKARHSWALPIVFTKSLPLILFKFYKTLLKW